jgi:tetratricopeptide (TPR) repeat protein
MEFRNRLPEGRYSYLEGTCLHYGTSMVYLPILDILRSCFDIRDEDQEQGIRSKMRSGLTRVDAKLLDSLSPLQDVLSLTVEDEAYLQIDPQQRRQRIFEAVRDLLIGVSQPKPLVVAMEDLHWIDGASQDFLDFFADTVSEARILLILLYRPEYAHARGAKSYCREIALDQLSVDRRIDLVHAILEEGEVVPELRNLILSKAGGNPLFVEELTRSLLDNRCILRKHDRYVLSPSITEIEVPDTIHGIIAARMDRLEENLKRVMQVASVIGREFAYRILATITGMKEGVKSSLLNLQGLEFVYEKRVYPEPEYIFKHALTQEVAYNGLLTKVRRENHEKIGRAIEEIYKERLEEYYELLAYHYGQSDDRAKAVEYLHLANQKAVNASATEVAERYFSEAMELLDTLPETEENIERRISLLVNQTNVFFLLLKMPEYHELLTRYEPLLVESRNQGLIGAFYSRLGHCEQFFGLLDQAIPTLARAAELCIAAGNAKDAGFAYMLAEYAHLWRGEYDRVLELKEEALRMMERSFVLRCYIRALTAACNACTEMGCWDEAVALGQQALHTAQDYGDNSLIAWAEMNLSAVYTNQHDLDRAIRYVESALARASTPGDKMLAQGFLAWAWIHAGEPRKGVESLLGILPVFKALRAMPIELGLTSNLAEGYWLAGESEKAKETVERLLDLAERCGARWHLGRAYRLLGEMGGCANPFEAASYFERSISIFQEIKVEHYLAVAYAGYGRLHKRQGNMEKAHQYLTNALEIFERFGTLIEPDRVRRDLAELPQ